MDRNGQPMLGLEELAGCTVPVVVVVVHPRTGLTQAQEGLVPMV